MDYNVVFECTSGEYAGIRTWSTYQSEANFEQKMREVAHANERIVAQGVSADEAIELCSTEESIKKALDIHYREFSKVRNLLG